LGSDLVLALRPALDELALVGEHLPSRDLLAVVADLRAVDAFASDQFDQVATTEAM